MSTRPGPWRTVGLHVRFLLHVLAGESDVLWLLAAPLLPVVLMLVMVFAAGSGTGMEPPVVVVIAPEDAPALRARLEDAGLAPEVHAHAPLDLDARLASGAVDVAAALPDDPLSPEVLLRESPRALPWVEGRVADVLLRRRAERLLGEIDVAPLAVEASGEAEDDGTRLARELAGVFGTGNGPLHVLGVLGIGALGTLIGFGLGPHLVRSARDGFDHLLALGTPRRAIYAAQLVAGALVQASTNLLWCALLGLGAAAVGAWLGVPPPDPRRALALLPLLLVLPPLALTQAATASLVLQRLLEDAPAPLQKTLPAALGWLALVGTRLFDDLAAMFPAAAPLPVVGAWALWHHAVEGGALVIPGLLLHVAYAALALRLGGVVLFLDETPLEALRRRWRWAVA